MSILRRITAFLFLFCLPCNALGEEEWYSFEQDGVNLSGRILYEDFFGPPNYGENPDTDSVETAVILIILEPITVEGNPTDPLNSETFTNISRIQLVVPWEKVEEKNLSGKKVAVQGYLFSRHTGYHRTDVLMFVKDIKILP